MATAKTKKGTGSAKKATKNLSPRGTSIKGGKQKSWNPAN